MLNFYKLLKKRIKHNWFLLLKFIKRLVACVFVLLVFGGATTPNQQGNTTILLGSMSQQLPVSSILWQQLVDDVGYNYSSSALSKEVQRDGQLATAIQQKIDEWKTSNYPENFPSKQLYDYELFQATKAARIYGIQQNGKLAGLYLNPLIDTMNSELSKSGFTIERASTNYTVRVVGATNGAEISQFGALLNAYKAKYNTSFELSPVYTLKNWTFAGEFETAKNTITLNLSEFFTMDPYNMRSLSNLLQHEGNHARMDYNAKNGVRDLSAGVVFAPLSGDYLHENSSYAKYGFYIEEVGSAKINLQAYKENQLTYLLRGYTMALASADLKIRLAEGLINGSTKINSASTYLERPYKGVAVYNEFGYVLLSDVEINGIKTLVNSQQVKVDVRSEVLEFLRLSYAKTMFDLSWILKKADSSLNLGYMSPENFQKFQLGIVDAEDTFYAKASSSPAAISLFSKSPGAGAKPANLNIIQALERQFGLDGPTQKYTEFFKYMDALKEAGVDVTAGRSMSGGNYTSELQSEMLRFDRVINRGEVPTSADLANLPSATEIRGYISTFNDAFTKSVRAANALNVPIMFVLGAGAINDGNLGNFVVTAGLGLGVLTLIDKVMPAIVGKAATPYVMGALAVGLTVTGASAAYDVIKGWKWTDKNLENFMSNATDSSKWFSNMIDPSFITNALADYPKVSLTELLVGTLNPPPPKDSGRTSGYYCENGHCELYIVISGITKVMQAPPKFDLIEERIQSVEDQISILGKIPTISKFEKYSSEYRNLVDSNAVLLAVAKDALKSAKADYENGNFEAVAASVEKVASLMEAADFNFFFGKQVYENLQSNKQLGTSFEQNKQKSQEISAAALRGDMNTVKSIVNGATDITTPFQFVGKSVNLADFANSAVEVNPKAAGLLTSAGMQILELKSLIKNDPTTVANQGQALSNLLSSDWSASNLSNSYTNFLTLGDVTGRLFGAAQSVTGDALIQSAIPQQQFSEDTASLGATSDGATMNPLTKEQTTTLINAVTKSGRTLRKVLGDNGKYYYLLTLPFEMGGFTIRVPVAGT